ncbi:unnamed protein product [Darwinula stevensoni]|uniref:DUF7027 domain-containing protein n=1 Tax=Darwinula stevensoni TaxID=69355 RepID=A0A7R9A6B4_9CRUS|nr:unnamed protein product [Darwinula stevensoni]CAG0893979.1 unnamed protein product [Darwinula stevensoni]
MGLHSLQLDALSTFVTHIGSLVAHQNPEPNADTNFAIAMIVVSGIGIIMNSLLIHGIRKSKRNLITPYLLVALVLLILMPLANAALLVFTILAGINDDPNVFNLVFYTVALFIIYPFLIHFFLVVYSYFKELENVAPIGAHDGNIRLEEPIQYSPRDGK